MSNINKIKVSGQTYNIQDENATKTVELTQAEYDALAVKDPNTFYIITDSEGFDLSNYYTKSETSGATQISTALASKADKSEIPSLDGYATETWVEGKGYLTEHQDISGKLDVSAFNTYSGSVNTQLNSKASESDLNALNDTVTAHTANASIHVTAADKAAWNAKSDFSGSYNDLTDKPTIPTVPTNVSDFTNDAGYITSSALDDYATTGDVQTATADMATKTWVGNQGYLTEHQSLSNYYKKSETSGATQISTALASKQNTLESGTNIKTINNESILGSGNIEIQGGGKAVSGGTNISVTTGETADTINCTLPIVMKNSNMRINSGNREFADNLSNCFTFGGFNTVGNGNSCGYLVTFGSDNDMSASNSNRRYRYAFGTFLKTQNSGEIAFSKYNVSSSASETFGDSGNTLFSVGNGTAYNARHNAFEIRQNGDIYITKDGQDVKLQDQLGGGGGMTEDDELLLSTALTDLNDRKADKSLLSNYQRKGDYVTTNTLNTRLADYETALDEQNVEEVTAYALNDLNNRVTDNTTALGGMKLIKITESEYAALTTKDENTLYIVVADPS